ncbi:hypothetical protein HPB50_006684 [Hyalomma asiaticum]|uniref:Uncharacterized protein n=1 Tax=Hyalomma asiaticum TaxID=266040 RepID=A0ACB7SB01_HYAAI|nr:hypothetical protein HPB50_006684 [Hyalomma asiaticum]
MAYAVNMGVFGIAAATKRPVVPSPRPTHASDPPSKPVPTSCTPRPPSRSSLNEPALDVEVDRVESSIAPSTERSSSSETSPPSLSRVPTSPERNPTSSTIGDSSDTANTTPVARTLATSSVPYTASPADRYPVQATSTGIPSDPDNDSSTALTPCDQQLVSVSTSPSVNDPARADLLPLVSDIGTMADEGDDESPAAPLLVPTTHAIPTTKSAGRHTSCTLAMPDGSISPPSDSSTRFTSPVNQSRQTSLPLSAPRINPAPHNCEALTTRRTGQSFAISPTPLGRIGSKTLPPQRSRVRRHVRMDSHRRRRITPPSPSPYHRCTPLRPRHATDVADSSRRRSGYIPTLCNQCRTRVSGDCVLSPRNHRVSSCPAVEFMQRTRRPLRNSQCRPPELA